MRSRSEFESQVVYAAALLVSPFREMNSSEVLVVPSHHLDRTEVAVPTKNPLLRTAHNRRYYLNGGKERILARNQASRDKKLAMVSELKNNPCTDCGTIFHPAAMQFDHTGTDKLDNVSQLVRDNRSVVRIMAEIAKCELVCANCHAVRTWARRVTNSTG